MGGLRIQGWSAGFQCRESLLGNLPGEQKPKCCSLGATQPARPAAGRRCWASIGQGAECSFPAEGSPRALNRGGRGHFLSPTQHFSLYTLRTLSALIDSNWKSGEKQQVKRDTLVRRDAGKQAGTGAPDGGVGIQPSN